MTVTSDHIDHIMSVMERAFDPAYGEAWTRKQISDALAMPGTYALLVDPDGELIGECSGSQGTIAAGFVLTRNAPGEEELLLVGVCPDYRARGLAQILIEHLFTRARKRGAERIFLEMRRGNSAIHLYRKLGFEPIGERSKYYRLANGERVDAITFGRSI